MLNPSRTKRSSSSDFAQLLAPHPDRRSAEEVAYMFKDVQWPQR
jgi:hypothetical protein